MTVVWKSMMRAMMLNCEQVTQAAGDFVERRLGLRARLQLIVHVAMCKGCQNYVEQFRLTMQGLRSLPQPAASPPSEQLLDQFRRQSGRHHN